jgi:hypothetical protein
MMLLRRRWVLVFLLIVMPRPSFGWIDTGHEIIASITYDELTPASRAAATALLKQHPRYEKDLLADKPEGFDGDRYAFMIAATWPDLVRAQNHPMHFVANHPAWHYIDIPYIKPGFTPPATQPSTGDAPSGPRDIVEALDKVTADLKNPATSPGDRAIALCWVLHLCGDIHQPLHAADFFSPQFPQGDKGGNSIIVLRAANQYSTKTNLHALWDELPGNYRSLTLVKDLADGLRSDPEFSREKVAAALQVRDFRAWAQESYGLAIEHCYLNGTIQCVTVESTRQDARIDIPPLPAGYVKTGEDICARRVVTASYRMADLLNSIFAAAPRN